MGYEPVHYRKVFLDDEDVEVGPDEKDRRSAEASSDQHDGDDADAGDGDDRHCSDERYHYSDDHESFSDDSERDDGAGQQEAGE